MEWKTNKRCIFTTGNSPCQPCIVSAFVACLFMLHSEFKHLTPCALNHKYSIFSMKMVYIDKCTDFCHLSCFFLHGFYLMWEGLGLIHVLLHDATWFHLWLFNIMYVHSILLSIYLSKFRLILPLNLVPSTSFRYKREKEAKNFSGGEVVTLLFAIVRFRYPSPGDVQSLYPTLTKTIIVWFYNLIPTSLL